MSHSLPLIEKQKKIGILDFGGQYSHLIASRIRQLGTYSEICQPRTLSPKEARKLYSGLIFSGGPSSVYDENAITSHPNLLDCGLPILGICYGHQLIVKQLGGQVAQAKIHEYGPANFRILHYEGLFTNPNKKLNKNHNNNFNKNSNKDTKNKKFKASSTVWLSHGDEVSVIPKNF